MSLTHDNYVPIPVAVIDTEHIRALHCYRPVSCPSERVLQLRSRPASYSGRRLFVFSATVDLHGNAEKKRRGCFGRGESPGDYVAAYVNTGFTR